MKVCKSISISLAALLAIAAFGEETPLDRVLAQMDAAAAKFHSAEASFQWDQFQKVVEETDTQKGKIYFRRSGDDTEMAADITQPDPKYVLYVEGKVQWYQPRIDQVTVYDAGKSRQDVATFLLLGFGGGGHELLKSFDVKYLGTEKLGGVNTVKLDLTPKAANIRNHVEHIWLWVDPALGVSVQQQLFQPGGDYRLAKYSDIRINQKISDSVFKLKTTKQTKFASPQG
jgi:outer membrane lipoprotein-sorting protein